MVDAGFGTIAEELRDSAEGVARVTRATTESLDAFVAITALNRDTWTGVAAYRMGPRPYFGPIVSERWDGWDARRGTHRKGVG
jgi:hypothetical protein